MSKKRSKNPAVIPIRMPEDLQEKIKGISKKSRLSEADIIRMSLDRGLSAVENMFEQPTTVAA
jgi:predicted DNA-binding protein